MYQWFDYVLLYYHVSDYKMFTATPHPFVKVTWQYAV